MARVPIVCTVAGSDPSGGAGLQADLKTFAAFGAYGCAVATALTAQNTTGVSGVHVVPAGFVAQQLRDVLADVAVDAVKIGMLASAEIADAVGEELAGFRGHVVLDPVMVATSGSVLMPPDAVEALWAFVARADVITPNLAEAAALLGEREVCADRTGMLAQATALRERGARAVLLKGGHLADDAADLLLTDEPRWFSAPRIDSPHTHGTGCTLASAVAAARCSAPDWPTAVARAKAYVRRAIEAGRGLGIGRGRGPLWHGVEA